MIAVLQNTSRQHFLLSKISRILLTLTGSLQAFIPSRSDFTSFARPEGFLLAATIWPSDLSRTKAMLFDNCMEPVGWVAMNSDANGAIKADFVPVGDGRSRALRTVPSEMLVFLNRFHR